MLLFVVTVGAYLGLWRVAGNPVDCTAWAGAVGCAVGLGWLDTYRRARPQPPAARPREGAPAT
jgi:hypothetical protein